MHPVETKKKIGALGGSSPDVFQKAILALEARRGSRIFCFIEGAGAHICGPTLHEIYAQRKEFRNIKTLEILIQSHGGHANIAFQIASFFRRHCKTLNFIVPFEAKSAAALMCLAADNIYLSEFGELGPIDVQVQDQLERGARPFSPLDEFKSLEFLRDYAVESLDYFTALLLERSGMSIKEALHESVPCVTAMMRPMYEKIDPLKFGEHRRMLSEGEEYAKRLLRMSKNPNYQEVAAKLVENYPVHDFVIDYQEALEELGLRVRPLATAEFELLESVLPMFEQGFYGFVKRGKQDATAKKPATQKRLAVLPKTVSGTTS
jgi:hypothetical protein